MKALVTGGAGFIGSHLVPALLDRGDDVTVVDNLWTGAVGNVPVSERVTFRQADVRWLDELAVDDPDVIFHLACPASPQHYQADPINTLLTAVEGTHQVLILAEQLGCPVVIASTSEVYGEPEIHPQREGQWGHVNPVGLRSCYDEGKRAAESIAMDYWRQYRTRIRIARIFNTYGPGMDPADGRVVPNLITQALDGEDLTVYGSGQQTRSLCYISDLIDGLLRLAATECTGPINLGNPEEVTINELAVRISELAGSSSDLRYVPLPADDPTRRSPNITLARDLLAWEPKVDLDEGLTATIEAFRRVRGTQAAAAGV